MPGPEAAVAGQRLFFALWPPAPVADRLFALAGSLADACGGRAMGKDTLHLTLAFLGEVPAALLPPVLDAAESIPVPAGFEFKIDMLGWWKHNRIVWAGVKRPSSSLADLADDLRNALQARGLKTEARTFSPHVTLVRKASVAPTEELRPALTWPVSEMVLVASQRAAVGSRYTRLATWPLRSGEAPLAS